MKKQAKEEEGIRSECPVSCTLDLIGDKWSLLIIRDMMYLGKTTYNEFLSSKEGISTNILRDRLIRLTEDGLITFTGAEKRKKYELTKKGADLRPVLESLGNYGLKYSRADKEFLKHVRKTMKI
jgi:DNA-binding HxlR family transcriptional regulator